MFTSEPFFKLYLLRFTVIKSFPYKCLNLS